MHLLTLRELVLISDVSAAHASWSFGQNHAAHMTWIDFHWFQGAIFIPGIKHHITVNLWQRQMKYKFENKMGQYEFDMLFLKTYLCKHKGSIEWETCLPMLDGLDRGWTTPVQACGDQIGGDFIFLKKIRLLVMLFML